MKYIKNTAADLKTLFEERITADSVAEQFAVWDASLPATEARAELARLEFDIVGVGVGVGPTIAGYARREEIGTGLLGDHVRPLSEMSSISADAGLRHAVEKVFAEQRVIVQSAEGPLGIITRGDMNKAPVRMWLFSLVTLLEMQMLRVIRRIPHAETFCQTQLPPSRLAGALKTFDDRMKNRSETDLLDCLHFGDKVTLLERISRNQSNARQVGIDFSPSDIASLRMIEKLRNEVAHGNDLLLVHAQRNLPDCAQRTERLLETLEKAGRMK